MSKHTPSVSMARHQCAPFNGRQCSSWVVTGIDSLYGHPMTREDAQLIVQAVTAAPDLLEVLKDVYDTLEFGGYPVLLDRTLAAIAKSEGK